MYSLNSITKRNIENCVSLLYSKLISMEYDDDLQIYKSTKNEKIDFPKKRDSRK